MNVYIYKYIYITLLYNSVELSLMNDIYVLG